MNAELELESKFWKALGSDMTMMLGVVNVEDGHARPMTAQLVGEEGPIWFFTSNDTMLVKNLNKSNHGVATFVSKNNDLYATVHGRISLDNSRAMVDRLWNSYIAAWYEGGKSDPKLALLRFELDHGEIWLSGSGILAGIKMLLGSDPKKDFKDNVAEVDFRKPSSAKF